MFKAYNFIKNAVFMEKSKNFGYGKLYVQLTDQCTEFAWYQIKEDSNNYLIYLS